MRHLVQMGSLGNVSETKNPLQKASKPNLTMHKYMLCDQWIYCACMADSTLQNTVIYLNCLKKKLMLSIDAEKESGIHKLLAN